MTSSTSCAPLFHASGLITALLVGAYTYIADQFHASTLWKESDAMVATNTYLSARWPSSSFGSA